MPRKPLPKHLKKENITFRFPQWLIDEIRKIDQYNSVIEKLIMEYIRQYPTKKDKS